VLLAVRRLARRPVRRMPGAQVTCPRPHLVAAVRMQQPQAGDEQQQQQVQQRLRVAPRRALQVCRPWEPQRARRRC
jgi:hypothetical protein